MGYGLVAPGKKSTRSVHSAVTEGCSLSSNKFVDVAHVCVDGVALSL